MKQKSTLRRIIEFAYDCRGKMIISCNLRRAAATGAFASGHSAEHNGHPY